ncbi:hypothetical protein AXA65_12410 [Chryseobacterium sp. FP211-J200]|nr:hypothetical protein AXA65_12410 [Chryseobacterium sp. FP211-J200]
MARQNDGFAELFALPCHPSGLIPFPFGFSLSPLRLSAFFFPVFLLEKLFEKRSRPPTEADHQRKQETRKVNVTICEIFKTKRL